jgi:hypothetical protein
MCGQIDGLFYRYKSKGGFEYVSDFLIGPRTSPTAGGARKSQRPLSFVTHRGDSGTLWLLESMPDDKKRRHGKPPKLELLPLAMQWGAQVLDGDDTINPRAYVLATCLSTVCNLLDVDPIREWNLGQPETWGAVGHFSIAARVAGALSGNVPKLKTLMSNHLELISHDDATILTNEFKGLGKLDFVPLADVPDFVWKHGEQGFKRGKEGPNHFADMDQERPGDGKDLLALCKDARNISAKVWNDFYSSVKDPLTGQTITQAHRGLLPFRVWQIFDEMVAFADKGWTSEFLCAAGVLTHYIGDACQPLHISYMFNGDPDRALTKTVMDHGVAKEKKFAFGDGVHGAYEDEMVNANRKKILDGLAKTSKVTNTELITSGFEAAKLTVALMRKTFERLPPIDIVDAYVQAPHKTVERAAAMWKRFGTKTIHAMQDGTHLLAVLWESAWTQGHGNQKLNANLNLKPEDAISICDKADFLRSYTIGEIGAHLKAPGS